MGYYSGMTFQNQLRLTTQMPNIIELYTNNETTRVREVFVGTQKVLLRRARTKITAENADVLSFLELMNDLTSEVIDDEKKRLSQDLFPTERLQEKTSQPTHQCSRIRQCAH